MKLSPPSIPDEMKNVDSELVYVEEDDALKLSAPTDEMKNEEDDALKLSAPTGEDEFNSVDSEIVSVEDNDALKLSAPSVSAVDDEDDMPEEATMEQVIAAYEEEQPNIALANPVNPFIRPNPRNRADWVEGDYIDFANWVNFEKFYMYVRADDLEIVTTWVINNPWHLNTHLWF